MRRFKRVTYKAGAMACRIFNPSPYRNVFSILDGVLPSHWCSEESMILAILGGKGRIELSVPDLTFPPW